MSVYLEHFSHLNPDEPGRLMINFIESLPAKMIKKIKKVPNKYSYVALEALRAYSDCWDGGRFDDRKLNWCASKAVPRDVAVQIMEIAVPDGYNDFRSALLKKLPEDTSLLLAREGSPCIYCFTDPGQSIATRMKADEYGEDLSPNLSRQLHTVRIWWD